ncbi:hypothetical protein [Candidatus Poriferisodalis sp.]|uniref:hypothetical protein n=1 Tax=Candidatus Poriferisodalis sp. TaxID=3101277 RepID=UPI003B01B869
MTTPTEPATTGGSAQHAGDDRSDTAPAGAATASDDTSHAGADPAATGTAEAVATAQWLRPGNESEIAQIIRNAIVAVEALIAETNDVGLLVLEQRIAADEPVALAEIGRQVGRTGERIRGIQWKLQSQINTALEPYLSQVAEPLTVWLGDFVGGDRLHGAVAALAGAEGGLANRIISRRLMVELGYQQKCNAWVNSYAIAAASSLRKHARAAADCYGCVDEGALRQTQLGHRWADDWDELVLLAELTRVCGMLVVAPTRQAQIAAALRSIGRPASKEEIADRLGAEIGGPVTGIAGALGSMNGVVRASKTTWGFEKWVDDVYEGIPAEIRQRIEEDGGSTRLGRLLDELPRLFGVGVGSVRATLNTPAFVVEHGWVREATEGPTVSGDLEGVADAVTHDGDLVWTFEVESDHLRGYSLTNVPPEVSVALGARFGDNVLAEVRSPSGCPKVSVIWRKTSMRGPEIGRLGDALRTLGARAGSRIGLLIHGPSAVSLLVAESFRNRTRQHASSAAPAHGVAWIPGRRFSGVRTVRTLHAHTPKPASSGTAQGSDSTSQGEVPRVVGPISHGAGQIARSHG